jgi:hypothetical protein
MADGGTPTHAQIAETEARAAPLPDLRLEATAADAEAGAAELALAWARDERDRAHADAVAARLPHLRAWGALLRGRYPHARDEARAAEAAATDAVADARQKLQHRETARDNARARVSTALAAATALPAMREARRLADLTEAGDPLVAQVEALDADLARVEALLTELTEADDALARAAEAVREASRRLASAKSWGTYDTWFGGDLISSMVKHDRIDESNDSLRDVSSALATARRELADVDVDLSADPLVVDSFLKTTDIWFDNFFSDISVQGRITDHIGSIDRLRARLGELRTRVADRIRAAKDEREVLLRRRSALLAT